MIKVSRDSNKHHESIRPDFLKIDIACPVCLKLYGKTKKFRTIYSLKYHLTSSHDYSDSIESGLSINNVYSMATNVAQALQCGMFYGRRSLR